MDHYIKESETQDKVDKTMRVQRHQASHGINEVTWADWRDKHGLGSHPVKWSITG